MEFFVAVVVVLSELELKLYFRSSDVKCQFSISSNRLSSFSVPNTKSQYCHPDKSSWSSRVMQRFVVLWSVSQVFLLHAKVSVPPSFIFLSSLPQTTRHLLGPRLPVFLCVLLFFLNVVFFPLTYNRDTSVHLDVFANVFALAGVRGRALILSAYFHSVDTSAWR